MPLGCIGAAGGRAYGGQALGRYEAGWRCGVTTWRPRSPRLKEEVGSLQGAALVFADGGGQTPKGDPLPGRGEEEAKGLQVEGQDPEERGGFTAPMQRNSPRWIRS